MEHLTAAFPWVSLTVLGLSVLSPFILYRSASRRADVQLDIFVRPVLHAAGATVWALVGFLGFLLGLALVPHDRALDWGLIVLAFTPVSSIGWMIHLARRGRGSLPTSADSYSNG